MMSARGHLRELDSRVSDRCAAEIELRICVSHATAPLDALHRDPRTMPPTFPADISLGLRDALPDLERHRLKLIKRLRLEPTMSVPASFPRTLVVVSSIVGSAKAHTTSSSLLPNFAVATREGC